MTTLPVNTSYLSTYIISQPPSSLFHPPTIQTTNSPKMKTLLPFLLLFPYLVSAWGTLGHTTVAYIASNLVDADTTKYFQGILGNETGDYLAGVATWADSFRYTAAGRFSAPFHFIDAVDHPPRRYVCWFFFWGRVGCCWCVGWGLKGMGWEWFWGTGKFDGELGGGNLGNLEDSACWEWKTD